MRGPCIRCGESNRGPSGGCRPCGARRFREYKARTRGMRDDRAWRLVLHTRWVS